MNPFRESRPPYPPSRREFLRRSGMGMGSLALARLLDQQGLTEEFNDRQEISERDVVQALEELKRRDLPARG